MSILRKISYFLAIFLVFVNLIVSEVVASEGEVTLKEAINIGFQRAKEWNVKATLTEVNSVDENMGGSRGETGKRFNWFVNFMVPGTEDHLLIGISEKKITVFEQLKQSSQEPTIPYDKIKLDSPEVLQLAKDKYLLKQGKDWATGYHFTLDSIDGKPILSVFGNDKDKHFTRISFDAQNGEVVGAIHKLPYGGGLISKRFGTDAYNLTKKGMAITGIVAGNKDLVVWGDKEPTQFSTTNHPFIEWSHNNGESWTELKVNNYVTHAWFDMDDRLYAATEKELLAGITSKSNGTKILSLDHMIENIDYSLNSNIAVISNGNIYYTTNRGESWNQVIVPKPLYELQISDNGNLVGLTEEKKILQRLDDGWKEIKLPNSDDVPEDMKVIKNKLFITTQSGIWVRNLREEKWRNIQVDGKIFRLIKKGEKLFGITNRGEAIYSINTKGKSKPKKVFDARDVIVWDMDVMGDTLWITTVPDYSWEEMTMHQR